MQTADEVELSDAELRAASEEGRARVAADPADEAAAEALFQAVSRAAALATRRMREERPVAPVVAQAARLLQRGQDEEAEILLRGHLAVVRNDPPAMLLMANIASKCGFPDNAIKILKRSVEVDPTRTENWLALAQVLHSEARRQDKVEKIDEAFEALDSALAVDPENEEVLVFKASILAQVRREADAVPVLEKTLRINPENGPAWVNYAHALKTIGRFGEAVAAYRTAIAINPAEGPIWWLLADMKLARLFAADVERMNEALADGLPDRVAVDVHFALASAYDQAKHFQKAAEHLEVGNALRLSQQPHDIDVMRRGTDQAIATYTRDFFSNVAGAGEMDPAPIFIVGMPRSGSTLLEQILASHSAVEGTSELFAIQQIEGELFRERPGHSIEQIVADLDRSQFRVLGRRYLDLTRFHRRTDRPHFTDKNPGNWRQAGLIHATLPNAKIIDIRRNPLDCCVANYAQHFRFGANYSYGLREVASYYAEYVRLMRHLDEVLPRVVHRIIYEDLVHDTESEVRRAFEYLGLPFEDSALRFFETERAVHTPSAQQVRQPINRSGIGKWSHYEPWVGDLKAALGEMLDDWR